MDWSHVLAAEQLVPTLAVAGVIALVLGLFFGFERRTVVGALLLALGASALHPGGAEGLVADALRPFRALVDDAATRREERRGEIEAGAGGP